MKQTSKTNRLIQNGLNIIEKKRKYIHLKRNSETIGVGLWISNTRAQKRIKGIRG